MTPISVLDENKNVITNINTKKIYSDDLKKRLDVYIDGNGYVYLALEENKKPNAGIIPVLHRQAMDFYDNACGISFGRTE